ncbi:MAG: spondin domain-containing protein [Actinomycetota bacterium]
MKLRTFLLAALAAMLFAPVALLASPATAEASGEATYRVEVRNVTSGQYLTPPNWAAHTRGADVFEVGHPASPGVEAVAERGGVPVLAGELTAAIDNQGLGISGVGAEAPLAPGASTSFEFTTGASRFSLVSMIICTNDGFGGLDGVRLPGRDGQTRTYRVRGYDAGTELNTENRADIVPAPFCNGPGGTDQDQPEIDGQGFITRHRTLRGVGDLPLSFDWRGAVAEVTITRVPTPASYTVTITNATSGQYLTPPNWAAHTRAADVFQLGHAPSPGVAAVAELGGVPVLAAELSAAIDNQGLGVSGVAGDGPIPPGQSVTFDLTTEADRLSVVSMLICTNDGFAGLDSKRLPRWVGDTRQFSVRAFDAGAELNTENRADIVPAPFCNGPGGTDQDQPEIDGQGFITRHPSLLGVGDLPDSFDWRGPVAYVTVTRNS